MTRDNPDIVEMGVCRRGSNPADCLDPPFPDEAVKERLSRCHVIDVRVDKSKSGDEPSAYDFETGFFN